MAAPVYEYDAVVKRVVDGDTLVLTAAQLLSWPDEMVSASRDFVVRLIGVDTPERKGKTRGAGDAAKSYVESLVYGQAGLRKEARLYLTGRRDVYGRWLGAVRLDGHDLSGMLIESKHGVRREYAAHIAELAEADEGSAP